MTGRVALFFVLLPSIVFGGDLTAEQKNENKDRIKRHCEAQWPENFSMRAACARAQLEALTELSHEKPVDITQEEYDIITKHCTTQWADNFQLQASCFTSEYEGIRELRKF